MALTIFNSKLKGSTLLEALTALAIISTLVGASFSIYNQTISSHHSALSTKALLMKNTIEFETLNKDFISKEINVVVEPYGHSNELLLKRVEFLHQNGKVLYHYNYLIPNKP